ncbi:MAG: type II secretion system protein [Bacilli bacterium]|jgi:type IV pilus assembly protein PilA
MKKRGFTLVELLAVIVILAVILAIAVPNVLGIIENTRKESFAANGKMMANAAKTIMASEPKYVPSASGKGRIIPLSDLNLENIDKDVDGGVYDEANSYVVVVNDDDTFRYFITLKGNKRSIDLKENTDIVVDNDTTVTSPVIEVVGTTLTQNFQFTVEPITIEAAE